MFLVDTNIFVYAAIRQSQAYQQARRLIDQWRSGTDPWFATWHIMYEFLRVVTHRAILEQALKLEEARSFVDSLFVGPSFGLLVETDRHAQVLRELTTQYPGLAGNVLHDFHTVALMQEHGVREIRTTDTDFHQFKFLRVVNPLAP